MATKLRSDELQSSKSRLKLAARGKPYRVRVAQGIALGYRRTEGTFGTWSVIVADGSGGEQMRKFAVADDYESANGKTVLSFDEAVSEARKLARSSDEPAQEQSLLTVEQALDKYKVDLMARGANPYNAEWPKTHLGAVLMRKPCVLITEEELTAWRNGLLGKLTSAAINRLMNALRAALTLTCKERTHVWRAGLKRLANAERSRNKLFVLPPPTIHALVAEACKLDERFGLLCHVLSETGMRPVQAARLRVGYLISHPTAPRLMVTKSAKGGGLNRAEKKRETYVLPITVGLAKKLKHAAGNRADDDPLLLRPDMNGWDENDPHQDYKRFFADIVAALELDERITAYCFRHSSITRQLLRSVPTRVVAANHNTSVGEIERTYSKYIVDHADDLTRAALVDHDAAPPADRKVVKLRR